MFFRFVTKHACDRHTDRQTERQTDRITTRQDCASIAASRGKNKSITIALPTKNNSHRNTPRNSLNISFLCSDKGSKIYDLIQCDYKTHYTVSQKKTNDIFPSQLREMFADS